MSATLEKHDPLPATENLLQLKRTFLDNVPALVLLLQLPYVFAYLFNLWGLSHYQFVPLLIAAVAWLGWERWSGKSIDARPGLVGSLVAASLTVTAFASLIASPWLAYPGFLLVVAACLLRFQDRETGKSLVGLTLPLLLIWQPPYSSTVTGDTILISRLQQFSARVSSSWLDMLGFRHHCPGTVLEFSGNSFGVEQACSGIQSFFALLCFAALLIVFSRRGWIQAILLLVSSVFWALLMNTLRITLIPIAFSTLGVDLSHGVQHAILGYATMLLAFGMLLSTDQLLLSLLCRFKPVVTPVAAKKLEQSAAMSKSLGATSGKFNWLWVVAAVPFFLLQTSDVVSSWGEQRQRIDFFSSNMIIPMSPGDAPKTLNGWNLVGYNFEDRERGTELGQRSDVWTYNTELGPASLSLDQPFPGWHELTVCYQNSGWVLSSRDVITPDTGDWPFVVATFSHTSGRQGFLVYGMFDDRGRPYEPPGAWDNWSALKERATNRLAPSVRGALFRLAAYQVQIYVMTPNSLTDGQRQAMIQSFVEAREKLKLAAMSKE